MVLPEPVHVAGLIAEVFDDLEIPYFICGSLASSVHGIPRATQDADIVADIRLGHAAPFVEAVKSEFYVDALAVRDAIERRSSFNVVHLQTMFKVDVFVFAGDAASLEEMQRRQRYELSEELRGSLFVATPEDTILRKLHWYREGGEISEKQWSDVLGVLRVQADRLDFPYLQRGARRLGVGKLLQRAFEEAGLGAADG